MTPEKRAAVNKLASLLLFAAKSINQALREYESTLTRFAYDVLNGNSSAVDFRRLHKALIKASARSAFEEGWREGGGKLEDTEADDIALIGEFVSEQTGFVNDFAAWLATTNDEGKRNWEMKRRILADRTASWVLALQNFAERVAARARGDQYLTYDGEDGEESCDECQEYKGQRHRLSWWEKRGLTKRNGNDNFSCGRWAPCHHHFYYDDGKLALE